jgi:hypothetical protein
MSIINLLANDIWTDADILRRTESMIRSEFSFDEESVLNRKATAAALGAYEFTEDEQYELIRYTAVAENARVEYRAAVRDRDLLNEVFKYEEAEKTLSHVTLADAIAFQETSRPEEVIDEETGEVTNQEELDQYDKTMVDANYIISLYGDDVEKNQSDRAAAQQIVDNASEEVTTVVAMRK